jgi:hypothetical protein
MILLKNKPQVAPPDPNYLFGSIKDDTGVDDGTPVTKLVYGDMHEFLESIMFYSGITANNLPDNDVNGYQLMAALQAVINQQIAGPWKTIGAIGQPAFKNSWVAYTLSGTLYAPSFRIEAGGTLLRLRGCTTGGAGGSVICTLTGPNIPSNTVYAPLAALGTAVCRLSIQGLVDSNPGDVTLFTTGASVMDLNCAVPLF